MNYRTMPAKEQEYWLPFLLARDGYCCDRCKKSVDELIKIVNVIETLTGKVRKNRVLVINHKNGDSYVTSLSIKGDNLNLLCYSCNKLWKPVSVKGVPDMPISGEQFHKLKNEPQFYNFITNELIKFNEVCYKMIVNAGAKKFGSQITLERYIETELFTKLNIDGKFERFEKQCEYEKCNGDHIAFRGEVPKIVTDTEVKIKEELKGGKISFDESKYDPIDQILDKMIIKDRSINQPLSTEQELFSKFPNLRNYIDWN